MYTILLRVIISSNLEAWPSDKDIFRNLADNFKLEFILNTIRKQKYI